MLNLTHTFPVFSLLGFAHGDEKLPGGSLKDSWMRLDGISSHQ
jgi:hypothetical protein